MNEFRLLGLVKDLVNIPKPCRQRNKLWIAVRCIVNVLHSSSGNGFSRETSRVAFISSGAERSKDSLSPVYSSRHVFIENAMSLIFFCCSQSTLSAINRWLYFDSVTQCRCLNVDPCPPDIFHLFLLLFISLGYSIATPWTS